MINVVCLVPKRNFCSFLELIIFLDPRKGVFKFETDNNHFGQRSGMNGGWLYCSNLQMAVCTTLDMCTGTLWKGHCVLASPFVFDINDISIVFTCNWKTCMLASCSYDTFWFPIKPLPLLCRLMVRDSS
jgi:hypothetical protein